MSADWLVDGDSDATVDVVLAHGAGAPMDSPFMQRIACGLAANGMRVIRFEFPYMAKRRDDGKKRGPDPASRLLDAYREVVSELDVSRLVIGGKSLGGRMASMIADELGVRGLICLGYPFHTPGKPEKTRTAHLETLRTPALIVQGERDTFGNRDDVADYALPVGVELHWIADGDHSLVPRKRSGLTEDDNLEDAIGAVSAFIGKLEGEKS